MTTFYIARHGETEWNVKGLLQGQRDSPLTKTGIAQAQMLGSHLQNVHFDHVFSSDLLRAKRTAEIALLEKKLAIKTTHALREKSFGHFEGQPGHAYWKLFEQWQDLSYQERIKLKPIPGAESTEEVIARFITFMREVAVAYPSDTVLLVTHGGVIRHFLVHIGFAAHTDHLAIENTSYAIVESDGIDFFFKGVRGITILEK